MAHIPADRFNGGGGQKVQRVKLAIDQKIKGVPLKAGDTVDLPITDAVYLQAVERVSFVSAEAPKAATR